MPRVSLLALTLLSGVVVLTACGGGGPGRSPESSGPIQGAKPSFQPVGAQVSSVGVTRSQARRIEALALHDRFVEQVAGGDEVHVAGPVVPWVSEGDRRLLGGAVKIPISPAATFTNQRLPATITTNQKAPAGTPTLYRYVRMSATNVGELEVAVDLARGRAVRVEPSGHGYTVTKLELIGPPPKDAAAYAPEPGN